MNKTFRYTYKIVLQNGSLASKVYYGQHTTTNLFDGYRGSGKIVRNYYKKYPERSSSIVYIQKFYDTKEELDQAEKELIEPHLGKDYCLNIAEGGYGGDTFSGRSHTEETKAKISATKRKGYKKENHPNYGKHLSKETIEKISNSKQGKYKGSENGFAKPTTIINTHTNETMKFGCAKDCCDFLHISKQGEQYQRFLKGILPRKITDWKLLEPPTRA